MMLDPRLVSAAIDEGASSVLEYLVEHFAPEAPYLTWGGSGPATTLSQYGRTVSAGRTFPEALQDGVEFRRAGADDPMVFPAQRFGLVHARWIPFDTVTLANLTRWLRPGGVLLVESPDDYPAAVLRTGSYRAVAQAVAERLRLRGAHDLPARLMYHGLEHVECRHQAPDADGFSALLGHLLDRGAPWPEVHPADLRDWRIDPVRRTPGLMNVLAWGLKVP